MATQRVTLSTQIQNDLNAKLLNGEYKVGQYLPGEGTLAIEYGVSRTTIRDAVSGLVEKGFLERHHGKGVLVIDKSKNVAVDSVRNMILRGDYTVAEFIETREMIDNQIVGFATSRATEEEIARLWECIHKMEENAGNLEKYNQYDLQFHYELAKTSHNRLLITLYLAIEPMLKQIVAKVIASTGAVEKECQYHTQLLQSIENGDEETAVEKMRCHDNASKKMFKDSIKNNESLDSILFMKY